MYFYFSIYDFRLETSSRAPSNNYVEQQKQQQQQQQQQERQPQKTVQNNRNYYNTSNIGYNNPSSQYDAYYSVYDDDVELYRDVGMCIILNFYILCIFLI